MSLDELDWPDSEADQCGGQRSLMGGIGAAQIHGINNFDGSIRTLSNIMQVKCWFVIASQSIHSKQARCCRRFHIWVMTGVIECDKVL